jgi:transposase-like protein
MGAPRVKFSDEQLAEIREHYEGGTDIRVLARDYGCGWNAMRRKLVHMGIYQSTSLRSLTSTEKSEAARRYQDGESTIRLADAYGCDPETVRKALVQLGVEIRSGRRTGGPRVFSDEELADIRTRYEEGVDARSLAGLYDCNRSTIQRLLEQMGIYRPMKRKPFTEEEKAEIVRRYQDGDTPARIGRAYGTNGDVVSKVLRAAEVFEPGRYRYNKFTIEQVEQMAERYRAEESIYKLAKEYGVSVNGVWKILVAHGVEMRYHGFIEGRKGQHGKYTSIQVDPGDPLAVAMGWENGFVLEHRLVMARQFGRVLEDHETVHHINGDTHDNRPENLQLRNGRHGKGVKLVCLDCGSHNVESVPI